MEKILKSLSEIERILQDDMELKQGSCEDVVNILEETMEELRPKVEINKHEINITTDSQDFSVYKIDMNRFYLKNALSEVLVNALKFSNENTAVEVSLEVVDYQMVITILNSSRAYQDIIGIPGDYEERIFEPFFRIEGFINESYKTMDLGLGLIIVKKIIN